MVTAALAASAWTGHDTRLIVVPLIGIAVIVALIVAVRMHPFLTLIIGSAVVGFATGVGTLKEVGLLIAMGAMLGKLPADSGGADQVIDKLLARARPAAVPWLVTLVALVIGLPMFFETGLVLPLR